MNEDEYKAEQSIQAMRDIWDRQFTLPNRRHGAHRLLDSLLYEIHRHG